ncbi:hypothetical protein LRR81_10580 [Metabacillus sp. GX 13764]|uniref:hypothetical protein n=1 Tax=Metabacillus kandeliae TaxID=2900151 RepID=UPI001E47E17A|nr:hypothetical protein [Metabacillus kandeliae]MCD7034687.1 hypothetical protein [Metabacillus kandeliae]
MGQNTFMHRFIPESDLTYKAKIFERLLSEMDNEGAKFASMVKNEMTHQSGEIVNKICTSIEEHNEKAKKAISEHQASMLALANQYDSVVNTMNEQLVTVYYEEEEKPLDLNKGKPPIWL